MAAPPIIERHKHHFHRQSPIKESVRVATTANIVIATGLNVGDVIDGVTLADADRVLVKDQSTGAQNGIYVAGSAPARSYDVSTDDPAWGFIVYVRQGTANGGKAFKNTNTSEPVIDTTALTFAELVTTSAPTITTQEEGVTLSAVVTTLNFTGSGVTASGAGATTTIDVPGPDAATYIWKPLMTTTPEVVTSTGDPHWAVATMDEDAIMILVPNV